MDFYGVAQSVNTEGYISLELMYYDATRIKCTSLLEKEPFKPICCKRQPWKYTENRACVLPTTVSWTAALQPQSKPAATTPSPSSEATQPVAKLHNSEIAVFVFQGWGIFAKSKELSGSDFIPQALPLCKYSSCDQVPADLQVTKPLALLRAHTNSRML